jgi:carboxymethylenebutenolidase
MEEHTIQTADGPMTAAVSTPGGTPRGAVVVVQEAFGLTSHIVDLTARLAAEGWLAVAPALFHRQGSPVFGYEDFAGMREVFASLQGEDMLGDLADTLAWTADQGVAAGRTGMVGFCMGGSLSLIAATRLELGAAVTFYGGGVAEGRFGLPPLAEAAPSLRAPWLGLFGDQDKGIPVDDVEVLRGAAKTAAVPTEVVRYADAEHGFNCNDRASFHAESAADGWARMLAWFDEHLK